jgi:hypothetical protein
MSPGVPIAIYRTEFQSRWITAIDVIQPAIGGGNSGSRENCFEEIQLD